MPEVMKSKKYENLGGKIILVFSHFIIPSSELVVLN